jgi:hypothetical protein
VNKIGSWGGRPSGLRFTGGKEGQGVWKEGSEQVRENCDEAYDAFRREGPVINRFTNKFIARRSTRYEEEKYLY